MASKELGMIHNVSFEQNVSDGDSDTYLHDLSGQLTSQLQRMVRQGNMFKICGIDIGLKPVGGTVAYASVSGVLRYFAPTRGRCAAYRGAFKAMAEAMKVQGINMRDNIFYDFRVPLRTGAGIYANATPFANGATFNGADALALVTAAPNGVFAVHNESVQPVQTSATFSEGFGVFGNAGNDFVLNENQQGFQGNHMIASEEFEEIPFQVSLTQAGTSDDNSTLTWQWRPDPALYLAIMAGQFELEIEEVQSGGAQMNVVVSYQVSGWKSIMGNPDRKRRSRRTSSNSSTKKTTTTTVTTKKA